MGLQTCSLNRNRDRRELSAHGTLSFPCAGYSTLYSDDREDSIPWHWHEEIELIFIKSGNLDLYLPQKKFHLKKGELFFVNSNILHSAAAVPFCELHSLVFHPHLITGAGDSVFAVRYINPLTRCEAASGCLIEESIFHTDEFISAFQALARDMPGYEFMVRESLSHVCFALCQKYKEEIDGQSTSGSQSGIRIRTMIDYIQCHYQDRLELSQIAGSAGISERECLRCFKREIQLSPIQYLLKYRIAQGASMLLENSDMTVSEISIACGFDSPGRFSQLFRRYYQCSPREYRNSASRRPPG